MAISAPRTEPHFVAGKLEQVAPLKDDFAVFDLTGRAGDQAHDRKRMNALAAAAFPYDAERFALVQLVGDIIDGVNRPFLCIKPRDEVFDFH